MFFQNSLPSGASAIVMGRILAAFEARDAADEILLEPIGMKVLFAPDRGAALIDPATACGLPMASLITIAEGYSLDLLVLREVTPGIASNGICCDAILASHPCDTLTLTALDLWMKNDILWLVSQRARHSIRVSADGCEVTLGQPFTTPGQHLSGLLRAQAPIAIDMPIEECL